MHFEFRKPIPVSHPFYKIINRYAKQNSLKIAQNRFFFLNYQIILNSREGKKKKKAFCYHEEAMIQGK